MSRDKIAGGLRHLEHPIDDLVLDPNNARLHDADNVRMIAASMDRFGQDQVVIARRPDGVVVKGNGRVMAARLLGWTHVAVEFVDGTDAEIAERSVIDNRTSESSRWDPSKLRSVVGAMSEGDRRDFDFRVMAEAAPHEDDEPSRAVRMTAGNRRTFDEAVRVLRLKAKDPQMSEGRAIELIAADWLAGEEVQRGQEEAG